MSERATDLLPVAKIEALELKRNPLIEKLDKIRLVRDKIGSVVSSNLVSFERAMTKQDIEDVEYSTLLASLVADEECDKEPACKETLSVERYEYYINTLGGLGWNIKEKRFVEYKAKTSEFTVHEVVLELLSAIISGEDLDRVSKLMDALKALSDESKAIMIWGNSTSGDNGAHFLVGDAKRTNEGIEMTVSFMLLHTKKTTSRFLWYKHKKERTKLVHLTTKMVLYPELYSDIRDAVKDALIQKTRDNVDKYAGDIVTLRDVATGL